MEKTIGILGGMGPAATVDLFQKIVANTEASRDQEHIKILIYNNPKIPPRMLNPKEGQDPVPEIIRSARLIEQAGADFIIMPCHTAHIWYDHIQRATTIPFYSLITETVKAVTRQYHDAEDKRVLLLATQHTVDSRLYQRAFLDTGFEAIVPTRHEQWVVDQTIQTVKEGNLSARAVTQLHEILHSYENKGASLVMGCCTEIPLMFRFFTTKMTLIDPTLLFAKFAIHQALEG
ncbi:amino acid racemase [Bacillus sp. RO3]|nr:amino acid racemase [Bacillus sp. RO3]